MRTKKLSLTFGKLAFVVGTRAALGAGMGLLLSSKLPGNARRVIGGVLVALGAVTTVPAVLTLRAAAQR